MFPNCSDNSDEAFGFIYRQELKKDEKTNLKTSIDVQMNYKALVFVTDRLSLPNSWIM